MGGPLSAPSGPARSGPFQLRPPRPRPCLPPSTAGFDHPAQVRAALRPTQFYGFGQPPALDADGASSDAPGPGGCSGPSSSIYMSRPVARGGAARIRFKVNQASPPHEHWHHVYNADVLVRCRGQVGSIPGIGWDIACPCLAADARAGGWEEFGKQQPPPDCSRALPAP